MPISTHPDPAELTALAVVEVAARLKVSQRTAWRLIESRKLGAVHFGRRTRVLESELARFLAEHSTAAR